MACQEQNLYAVTLLSHVPDININAKDLNGSTVLHECVRNAWGKIVRDLINLHVNIHETDSDGETAFQLAKRISHFSQWSKNSVAYLLRHRYELRQQRSEAISMCHHERLGNNSRIKDLDTETLRLVTEML